MREWLWKVSRLFFTLSRSILCDFVAGVSFCVVVYIVFDGRYHARVIKLSVDTDTSKCFNKIVFWSREVLVGFRENSGNVGQYCGK